MKIGKILIFAMVVSSLFAISISSVMAVDENEFVTDGIGDVVHFLTQNVVDNHPDIDIDNIDITELKYVREDKSVTLTLKVEGIIEDRGKIDDISDTGLPDDPFLEINSVSYIFGLLTSNEEYQIVYTNNSCQVIYGFDDPEIVNLTENDFSVVADTLTINFEIKTINETYDSVSAQTVFQKYSLEDFDVFGVDEDWDYDDLEDLITFVTDEAPNGPLEIDYNILYIPDLGEVGKPLEFEGASFSGYHPHTYEWDFGDGSTSSEKTSTHVYEKAGKYNCTFTVTDNSGSSESFTGEIEIIDTSEENGTPGFEIVIFIVSIGIILFLRRK
jgi:hypothetical protein